MCNLSSCSCDFSSYSSYLSGCSCDLSDLFDLFDLSSQSFNYINGTLCPRRIPAEYLEIGWPTGYPAVY